MIKKIYVTIIAALCFSTAIFAQHSWSGIHHTSLKEAESNFSNPPAEFASHVIWGWEGPMDIETIRHDLDSIKTKGFRSVIFEAGYHLPYQYLSDEWFEGIRTGVMEAKARGLKVWLIDEGKYPSGFAGGKFSKERPELRMKAIVTHATLHVDKGATLVDQEVDPRAFSAVAVSKSGAPDRIVEIKDHKISFVAGLDEWDILLVGSDYRTGQTRAVNNPTGGKDTTNSLCDYLSPEAVRQFIDWTHEQYKKYLGDEFGKTLLGFRGDEPDFGYIPWTPKLVEEFVARKGYDPTPWFACLMSSNQSVAEKKFRADCWDVWSELFAINFFKQQADWCEENGLAHITHLNNDHNMPACIRISGSMFRDLSNVQIPGIDAIWNQIWPGTVNDYPKFASSISHVYGKPRTFSESFAAYNPNPTVPQARYAVNYQITRGINFFEFMFWMAGSKGTSWMSDPTMKGLNDYTNRATYLMAQGVPGARIAVYYPTSTFWLDNQSVNTDLVNMAEILLKHQRDFDWVDDDAFTEALKVGTGFFENKSGQRYYTLIIPSSDAISEGAWEKIQEFASRGGKVLFWGRRPHLLVGKTFKDAGVLPLMEKCLEEPSPTWTSTVAAAMPEPEMSLVIERPVLPKGQRAPQGAQAEEPATNFVHYTRRVMPDGDLYFIFNEGEKEAVIKADFDKVGTVREWNADEGTVKAIEAAKENGKTRIEMTLKPWEARIISIEKGKGLYNVKKYGVKGNGKSETAAIQAVIDKAYANGGGTVVFPRGKYVSGALFFPRGVNLRVEKGAMLQGVRDNDEYPMVNTRFEGIEREWRSAFLNFNDSEGVIVDGGGTIDGNGIDWPRATSGSGRPRLICFNNCDGGSISNLKLQNQASWGLHILYTEGFDVDGLSINARKYIPSSDGIDIDSSNGVHVSNTYIYVQDDCISIKSGKDAEGRRVARPSEDILVEDCTFGYGHGMVALGSEISGDIRNVTVRNCKVQEGQWGVIRFKSQPTRGGTVENILFENIEILDAVQVFDVNLRWGRGNQTVVDNPLTVLRNITVRNVHGTAVALGEMHGFTAQPLTKDVFKVENCEFKVGRDLNISDAELDRSGMKVTIDENLFVDVPGLQNRQGAKPAPAGRDSKARTGR